MLLRSKFIWYVANHTDPLFFAQQECSGPDLPLIQAEYLSEEVTCDSDFTDELDVEVVHRIDMEIFCGDQFDGEYRPFDEYFECGPTDEFRYYNTAEFPDQDFVFQCYESVRYNIVGLRTELTQSIPATTVFSDRVTDDCVTFQAAPTVSPAPTKAPIIMPTGSPTKQPTRAPTTSPTVASTEAPVAMKEEATNSPMASSPPTVVPSAGAPSSMDQPMTLTASPTASSAAAVASLTQKLSVFLLVAVVYITQFQ